MQNNNYLGIINSKRKTSSPESVLKVTSCCMSQSFGRCKHGVMWGVSTQLFGCCNHDAMWAV